MAAATLDNINPTVFSTASDRSCLASDLDDNVSDPVDAREVFDLIRNIKDPEHPLTLEQLNVVSEALCAVDDAASSAVIHITPTIPHCSMASLIGLSVKLKLLRTLPARFKIEVVITPGSHSSESAINKQLADKERVAAALENPHLLAAVNRCIAGL